MMARLGVDYSSPSIVDAVGYRMFCDPFNTGTVPSGTSSWARACQNYGNRMGFPPPPQPLAPVVPELTNTGIGVQDYSPAEVDAIIAATSDAQKQQMTDFFNSIDTSNQAIGGDPNDPYNPANWLKVLLIGGLVVGGLWVVSK